MIVKKRFYTPAEVAALLKVSSTTVMNRIHAGELPAVRVSQRIYRIPMPAFERFVAGTRPPEFEVEWREVDEIEGISDPPASRAAEAVEA